MEKLLNYYKYDIDLNVEDCKNNTVFYSAIAAGASDIVEIFLSRYRQAARPPARPWRAAPGDGRAARPRVLAHDGQPTLGLLTNRGHPRETTRPR